MLDLSEVSGHEQVRAREMMIKVMNFMGSGSDFYAPGNPVKLSDTPCSIELKFPRTGEDTESVLRDAGYTAADIEEFRTKGVI